MIESSGTRETSPAVDKISLTSDERALTSIEGSDGTEPGVDDGVVDLRAAESISWNPFYYLWASAHICENESRWFWRSVVMTAVHYLLQLTLVLSLDGILRLQQTMSRIPAYVLVSTIAAPVAMARTHILITSRADKANQPLLSRVVSAFSGRNYRALVLPALLHSSTQVAVLSIPCTMIPALLASGWDTQHFLQMLFTTTTIFTCAYIPAAIVLTRIEAAMLLRGTRTVVPVDSGSILGQREWEGEGDVGEVGLGTFLRAIKSVDRRDVLKALKNYAKWSVAFVGNTGTAVG